MKEEIDEDCKQLALAIFKEFLLDHLRDHTLDSYTFEILLENIEDYI